MKNNLTCILALSFLFNVEAIAQPVFPQNAKEAILVSTDVKNFIEAYKTLNANSDTAQVIQSLYLDKATPGLKEYVNRFNLSAAAITAAIKKYPEEYNKIEKFYAQMVVVETAFHHEMATYKRTLPQAVFPPLIC